MDIKFCEQCDMKLDYYTNTSIEPPELYLGCKACGYKEKAEDKTCIYNNEYEIELSEIINQNQYLQYDITLPKIKGNQNIKCPNKECDSNTKKLPSEIIYIKYDQKNMKYSYICTHCKQNWTN
jgi:hypothetical protein